MTAAPPWSVKGIDPESRQAAKEAARRAGLTLGAWLSQTIRGAASAQLARDPAGPGGGVAPVTTDWADPGDGPDGGGASSQGSVAALRDELRSIALRLDRHEAWTEETLAPLAARLEQLTASLAEIRAGSDTSLPELAGVVLPMGERLEALGEEVRALRERGEALETDTTRAISPLVSRLEEVSREIAELRANGETARLAEQLSRLSARVDQAGRVGATGENATNAVLERAVVRLAERLDRIEQELEEPRRKGMFGLRRP